MMCGEEKVLAEAMPAEDMAVPGFEHQTLECLACNDTERRLVFTDRVIVITRRETKTVAPPSGPHQTPQNDGAAASAPNTEATDNGSVEVSTVVREEELNAGDRVTEVAGEVTEVATLECEAQEAGACDGINIAAPGWVRATDKLRSYQADLHLRAEEAKKRNRDVEFDIAWDRFPAPPQRLLSHRRQRLRRKNLSIATDRSQSPAPAQDAEAVRRFDEFWNSLAPSRPPQQTASSTLPAAMAALPISLGVKLLEALEAAMPSLT
jgi:hypothetical protein